MCAALYSVYVNEFKLLNSNLAMRIISWNINYVRARLIRLLDVLRRHQPDIVCLQETKVDNSHVSIMELRAAGYGSITYGKKGYNRVAIPYRDPTKKLGLFTQDETGLNIIHGIIPINVQKDFTGNPLPNEARIISACFGNFRLVNLYVVNGVDIQSEQFKIKQTLM